VFVVYIISLIESQLWTFMYNIHVQIRYATVFELAAFVGPNEQKLSE